MTDFGRHRKTLRAIVTLAVVSLVAGLTVYGVNCGAQKKGSGIASSGITSSGIGPNGSVSSAPLVSSASATTTNPPPPEVVLRDASKLSPEALQALQSAPVYTVPTTREALRILSYNGVFMGVPLDVLRAAQPVTPITVVGNVLTPSTVDVPLSLPSCAENNLECGFSYSGGYDRTGPRAEKRCRITYYALHSDSVVVSTQIFYTNCGTCRQGVFPRRALQSVEGPVFSVTNMVCAGQPQLDVQWRNMPNFRVETLSGSSCSYRDEYFSVDQCTPYRR